jgi:hypothetical protein
MRQKEWMGVERAKNARERGVKEGRNKRCLLVGYRYVEDHTQCEAMRRRELWWVH